MELMNYLGAVLGVARPFKSLDGEGVGEARVHKYLRKHLGFHRVKDKKGRVIAHRRTIGSGPVAFLCHSDTVDDWRDDGKAKKLKWTPGQVELAVGECFHCMGADDGAGLALIMELVRTGYPGDYWVFRGEEGGCHGSGALAADAPELLAGITMAVSLDRRGTGDVIQTQAGTATASKTFTDALAEALGNGWKTAPGLWTDSARLAGIVPECTNLSVGYGGAHTVDETLDLGHLMTVYHQIKKVDWAALPISRDPKEVSRVRSYSSSDYYGSWNGWNGPPAWMDDTHEKRTEEWLEILCEINDWEEWELLAKHLARRIGSTSGFEYLRREWLKNAPAAKPAQPTQTKPPA